MVEIRVGESWKQNPAYVGGLRALAEGRSRGFSPRDIVDVVGIEVDGVDLADGLAEAALFDAMTGLVRAVRQLSKADGEAEVPLARAPVELRLAREGDELRLTLRARDDAGLVVREAVVESRRFFEAVRKAAQQFLGDLAQIHPGLGELRVAKDLSREAAQPGRRPKVKLPRTAPPPLAEAPVAAYRLEFRGKPQHLALCDAHGRSLWALPGTPAKTLAALAGALAGEPVEGVKLEPRHRRIVLGRASPVPLADLRMGLRTLALLLKTRLALPEEPAEEASPAVLEPRAPTKTAAVHAPGMPVEGLRRVLLRPAWRIDAHGPRPKLIRSGNAVLVRTSGHVELRNADGEARWSASVHDAVVVEGAPGLLAAKDGHGHVVLFETRHGTRKARVLVPLEGHLHEALWLSDERLAVTDGSRIHGLVPSQREAAWTWDPGRGQALRTAPLAGGLVAATEAGDLAALDAEGRVAFRARGVLDVVEWVGVDAAHGLALACGLDGEGAAAVAAVRLSDGGLEWQASLAGVRPQVPLLHRGRIALGYESTRGSLLAELDLRSGRPLFEVRPPGDGAVVPRLAGTRLVVPRVGGGLVAYDARGQVIYEVPSQDPDPALSPVRPRPMASGAGLVVLAAALLHVFDGASGRKLSTLEPAELAPDALVLLDGPVVVAAGRDGMVEAWRTAGHLRVVP